MFVPLILGSGKDREHAEKITTVLDQFGIPNEIIVASAHKVPEKVLEVIKKYDYRGEAVCYITIAGRSNALSGFVAANSIYPVIGCPPFSDKADMLVNIHSTLQMPTETPVLTVIDPQNAGLAAVKILATDNPELLSKVKEHLQSVKDSFKE